MEDFVAPEITVLVILLVAFVLLITERLRNDLVGVLIPISLWATGVLSPEESLSGFSSEPAIVVAAIFVLTAALQQTGVSDFGGQIISRLAGTGYRRLIVTIMPAVALLSAFTHHLTTTAMMLPVTMRMAREREIPPSKLLIPLSYAASLGTTITIIGAPAFLIASGALRQAGQPELGIFSIAPIGLAVSVVGTIFVLLIGDRLLPDRQGTDDPVARFRLDDYFTEVTVLPGSPLLERSAEAIESDERYGLRIVGRLRNGRGLRARFQEGDLKEGDVLLVRTSPEHILAIREESGIELHPVSQYQGDSDPANDRDVEPAEQLVQAVIAPGSSLIGRSIAQVDFRRQYDAIVLSLWRQSGWLQDELAQIKLRAGDVVVLQGDEHAISQIGADRGFLMLLPFRGERSVRSKAPLAAAIMLGTIAAAALGLPLVMVAVAGAAAVILTGCLTTGQAYRAIDQRIFVFIAGAIPIGIAVEKSGAAALLADWLQGWIAGASPFVALLAIFLVVAVVTQFMSDAATTALFAPVAIAIAQGLGHSPVAYAVTVAMAAVTSFLTPLGHHGNLLIYHAGGYRFRDFVRAGLPLTCLVAVVVAAMAPILWPS